MNTSTSALRSRDHRARRRAPTRPCPRHGHRVKLLSMSSPSQTAGEPPVPNSPPFPLPAFTLLRPTFVPCSSTIVGKQWPRCAFAEDVTPSRCLLHIPTSSRLAADLRPSSCSARSNLEPSRHRLRHRQNPCPFLYLCINLLYDLSMSIYA